MPLQSSIIHHLLRAPMSLAEIQASTEASLPTIRRAVQSLSEAKWISITGQAEANGGRPATLYGINNDYYIIIGLQLQLPGLHMIVSTLNGEILERINLFQGVTPDPNSVVRVVMDEIQDIRSQYADRPVIGLSVAAPGFIDLESGEIIAIGRVPSWKNFPICRHLSESTGLPIQIANDVDCMAIAELENDLDSVYKNIVYIGYCEGVKASLIFNGNIFKGSIGNVGLIDPDLLHIEGLNVNQDIHRLLTTNGLIESFIRRVRKLDSSAQPTYQPIISLQNENEKFNAILRKALDHDEICYPLVKDLILILSTAIANIIHLLLPDEVIIGGLLNFMPKPLFDELGISIRSKVPSLISNNLLIKQGMMKSKNLAARGAVKHFLHSKMDAILHEN